MLFVHNSQKCFSIVEWHRKQLKVRGGGLHLSSEILISKKIISNPWGRGVTQYTYNSTKIIIWIFVAWIIPYKSRFNKINTVSSNTHANNLIEFQNRIRDGVNGLFVPRSVSAITYNLFHYKNFFNHHFQLEAQSFCRSRDFQYSVLRNAMKSKAEFIYF